MLKRTIWVALLLMILCLPTLAWAATEDTAITMDRVKVPLIYAGKTYQLDAMLYKPQGDGPFPAMVMTHGTSRLVAERAKVTADTYYVRQATMFAKMGIAVLFVARRGFGISDGPYAEEYQFNANGTRNYTKTGLAATHDLSAAVRFLQEKPFVDKQRVVLLGQSTGGHSVMATGSLNLPGVIGIINFAGGRGSTAPDTVRDEANLVDSFGVYGKTFKMPSIWFYSQNDHYFGPSLARRFLAAFQAAGGNAEFVSLPANGDDGHSSFSRAKDNWYPAVLDFLRKIGIIQAKEKSCNKAA